MTTNHLRVVSGSGPDHDDRFRLVVLLVVGIRETIRSRCSACFVCISMYFRYFETFQIARAILYNSLLLEAFAEELQVAVELLLATPREGQKRPLCRSSRAASTSLSFCEPNDSARGTSFFAAILSEILWRGPPQRR